MKKDKKPSSGSKYDQNVSILTTPHNLAKAVARGGALPKNETGKKR